VTEPPKHKDLRNPNYNAWMRFLKDSEAWSADRIQEYQISELRRITDFAYQRAPGYRKHFESVGLLPSEIRSTTEIRKIPFLTKEMIRDQLPDFSVDIDGRSYVTTGGSTGIPTGMYRDPVSYAKELASKAHQYHRIGWHEGDRQIVFKGLQILSADQTEFVEEFNELRCSTYQFGTEQMEVYRQRAMKYRPAWIRCYPSSGYVMARFLKETGRSFPPLKGILCSSEQLYDFQKDLFAEVFGKETRIFSHYGHYEMAALAGFCEFTDTYHVLPQYGYVELVNQDGQPVTTPGSVGEIVATSFIMHATPFIRYRTEDLAIYKSNRCDKCGRPYQIWERVEGRLQELVVTLNGRLISTSMLNMHDDSYDQVRQFQFHQSEPGIVTFRYIPKAGFDEGVKSVVKNRIQSKLGNEVDLIMKPVADIPLTVRGKHRLLIQELDLGIDHPSLAKAMML